MNDEKLQQLLGKAKLSLRISTDAFDTEISDLISAAIEDMETRGVLVDAQADSPKVTLAILTYVKAYFGEPEYPERLKASYDEQLMKLMTTSNYTNWW